MPRVPFNPTQAVARPQGQPRIDNTGSIRAIDNEAVAKSQMIQSFQGAISAGMDLRQDKVERDTFADNQRYESMASKAQLEFENALDKIEVKDGVNFQEEADALVSDFTGTLSDWIEASGNVRHSGKHRVFIQKNKEIKERARAYAFEKVQSLERARNIGAGKRGIETGIKANDPDAIERGITTLHLEKARGYVSEDEAEMMYQKHVESAEKMADDRILDEALLNLRQSGDRDAYREKVRTTKTLTDVEQETLILDQVSSFAYNGFAERYQAAQSMDELEVLQTDVKSDPDLDDNQRKKLSGDVLAGRRKIKRSWAANAARDIKLSEKDDFDFDAFLQRTRDTETANGYDPEDVKALISIVTQNRSTVEAKEEFKIDKEDPEYRGILNELALEAFEANDSGNPDKKRPKETEYSKRREKLYKEYRDRIEDAGLGATATANLWKSFLTMKIQDLRSGDEGSSFFDGMSAREYSPLEQQFRMQMYRSYQKTLNEIGTWGTFAEDLQEDSDTMRDFFIENPNPSFNELNNFREKLNLSTMQQAARTKLRGSVQPSKSDIVTIRSKDEFDALAPGTRFIYNGREGQK